MNFGLPTVEKLKSKRLLDNLFKQGKGVSKYPIKLYYLPIDDATVSNFKVGFSVPKRNVKLAVKRNKIKRLMREAFRKSKHDVYLQFAQPYALMYVYLGKDVPNYSFIEHKIKLLNTKFLNKESKKN